MKKISTKVKTKKIPRIVRADQEVARWKRRMARMGDRDVYIKAAALSRVRQRRLTEAGDVRTTEDGEERVTEDY